MTDAKKRKLITLVSDPEAAFRQLPKAEREAYEAAQRSVVEARRAAQAEGNRIYIV